MLTRLKYTGVSNADLLTIYCLFILSITEYCSVAFHSSLTVRQSKALNKIQSTCLRVILKENYISYEHALQLTGLQSLHERREQRCFKFSLKSLKHPQNSRLFPYSENNHYMNVRSNEPFKENYARTESYRQLNPYFFDSL